MARDGRQDTRDAAPAHAAPRDLGDERPGRHVGLPDQRSSLPRGRQREVARTADRVYRLRGSEVRLLETVGTFRVVPVGELEHAQGRWSGVTAEVRRLTQEGLLERTSAIIGGRSTPVVTLTRDAKDLLEAYRDPQPRGREQQYHAGFVKPRELAHDAQLYAMYRAEATRIEAEGGRVTRVALDYELKRDYQVFLNRRERPHEDSVQDAREAFARECSLPIIDGHLELPDLRIEFEGADGIRAHRDVELLTEHYSRGQLSGKARAGFVTYRLGPSGSTARAGGTPFDPRNLEWLG